jgi:LuxR family maltose regulon positive regulatory protein
VLYLSALRILLHRARIAAQPTGTGPVAAGIQFAGRLLALLLERQFISLAIEAHLLRAQLHTAAGSAQNSQADLLAALDLAEPEGYLSPFLMEGPAMASALAALLAHSQPGSPRAAFIQRILAVFPAQPSSQPRPAAPGRPSLPAQEWTEPLTSRELEVLGCMAAGQTYAEMASRLVVSINTVRSHVKSIYAKLGVNNRTAAIAAARQKEYL